MSPSTRSSTDGGNPLKVALLGCWGIGLSVLEALAADERVQVVSVLTRQPRGDDAWAGVVFQRAKALGLPVASFEDMDEETLGRALDESAADLLLVHAYPRRLPREVFDRLPLGTVNVHPSLLPRYRGPAPTLAVLRDKAEKTGLTAHVMDDGLDTGPVISQRSVDIFTDDTVDTVIERLKTVVEPLMRETLDRVLAPNFEPTPQDRLS